MSLTIAARVEDLPDPVGPVTRIRPWPRRVSPRTTAGTPSWSKFGIWYGIRRNARPTDPRCLKALIRKRAWPFQLKEKSRSPRDWKRAHRSGESTSCAICSIWSGRSGSGPIGTRAPSLRMVGAALALGLPWAIVGCAQPLVALGVGTGVLLVFWIVRGATQGRPTPA